MMSNKISPIKKFHVLLSADDAHILLQNKDNFSYANVNIRGRLTALSEIFKIRRTELFILMLDNILKIMITKDEFLKWHQVLTPVNDFVFTNLKPATIRKGVDIPFKVFMPSSKSTLFMDNADITSTSLKKWLHDHSIDIEKVVFHDVSLNIQQPSLNTQQPSLNIQQSSLKTQQPSLKSPLLPVGLPQSVFVSYKGIITDIISSEFGIYNIDGNIRLFTSHLPTTQHTSMLTIGSDIIVYNVHYGGSKQPPKIRLYCCARSTLRVITRGSSTVPETQHQLIENCQNVIHRLVNVYCFTKQEIELLRHLYEAFCNVLKLSKRKKCDILKVLQLSSTCCPRLLKTTRNIIQEFCDEPHKCYFYQKAQENGISVPEVISVEYLLELGYKDYNTMFENLKNKYENSFLIGGELSEQLYWSYDLQLPKENNRIIVGWLDLCPKTGRLVFRDGYSQIDVVITSTRQSDKHICKQTCLDKSLTCPYVHLHQIGTLVVINSYNLISEQFIVGQFPNVNSICKENVTEFQRFSYLLFSMQNCRVINPPYLTEKKSVSNNDQINNKTEKNANKTEENSVVMNGFKRPCSPSRIETNSAKLIKISNEKTKFDDTQSSLPNKDPSISQTKNTQNKDHLQNGCQERFQNSNPTASNNWKTVLVSHKESLKTESKHFEISLKFSALGYIMHEISKVSEDKMNEQSNATPETSKVQHEPIELVFQGPTVKWYDMLVSGAVYDFSKLNYVNYNVPSAMQNRVKNAVQRSNARKTVTVSTDCIIRRKLDKVSEDEAYAQSATKIINVLNNSCTANLVSIVGVIIARKHCESILPPKGVGFNEKKLSTDIQRNFGVSMIGNKCVQLQLKCLEDESEISVYLKLERTSYPLGLVYGTVIQFDRLERKKSKHGTVYCHYTPVSSFRILSFSPSQSSGIKETVNNKDIDVTNLKLQYVLEAIKQNSLSPFVCHGRIYQIVTLRIECRCCVCGSVYTNSACSNPSCKSRVHVKLSGKISFLFDDGSTVCKSFLTLDSDIVQLLLNLTAHEVESLTEELQNAGQISITNLQDFQDIPIAFFLQELCNSHIVKKTWQLTLRPFYTQDNHKLSADNTEIRNVHVCDRSVETRCLPYWNLECIKLEECNRAAFY